MGGALGGLGSTRTLGLGTALNPTFRVMMNINLGIKLDNVQDSKVDIDIL